MFNPKPKTVNEVVNIDKIMQQLNQVCQHNAEEAVRKEQLIIDLEAQIEQHDVEGHKASEVMKNLKSLMGV